MLVVCFGDTDDCLCARRWDRITCLSVANEGEQMWNINKRHSGKISFFGDNQSKDERKKKKILFRCCSKDANNIQSHGIWFSLSKNELKKKRMKITQDDTRHTHTPKNISREISVEIMIHNAIHNVAICSIQMCNEQKILKKVQLWSH